MQPSCEYVFAGCNRIVGAMDWCPHAGRLLAFAAASQALVYDVDVRAPPRHLALAPRGQKQCIQSDMYC
jgi:hypothetical protein